jgi:tRNA (guanine37-N1)-methyltransferase
MHFGVISIFPEMFAAIADYGVTGRAIKKNIVQFNCWNPRDFTVDIHKTVDDRPYGGGPGMVMKVQPLRDAIVAAKQQLGEQTLVIALTPQGQKVTQATLQKVVNSNKNVIFVAGRYEGIDERLFALIIDQEWSLGDFVLSGGELPAMAFMDGMIRLVDGVLGDERSAVSESFTSNLLDFPQYTRPENFEGMLVPEVLLSGDHAKIARWRLDEQHTRTMVRRPDLYKKVSDLNE